VGGPAIATEALTAAMTSAATADIRAQAVCVAAFEPGGSRAANYDATLRR
jgi:hypothetical protein